MSSRFTTFLTCFVVSNLSFHAGSLTNESKNCLKIVDEKVCDLENASMLTKLKIVYNVYSYRNDEPYMKLCKFATDNNLPLRNKV